MLPAFIYWLSSALTPVPITHVRCVYRRRPYIIRLTPIAAKNDIRMPFTTHVPVTLTSHRKTSVGSFYQAKKQCSSISSKHGRAVIFRLQRSESQYQTLETWSCFLIFATFINWHRWYVISPWGTAAAVPPPSRPSEPALCGSCPLVTPYYCRVGDLLCLFV